MEAAAGVVIGLLLLLLQPLLAAFVAASLAAVAAVRLAFAPLLLLLLMPRGRSASGQDSCSAAARIMPPVGSVRSRRLAVMNCVRRCHSLLVV